LREVGNFDFDGALIRVQTFSTHCGLELADRQVTRGDAKCPTRSS
jgi:hypothetical protein